MISRLEEANVFVFWRLVYLVRPHPLESYGTTSTHHELFLSADLSIKQQHMCTGGLWTASSSPKAHQSWFLHWQALWHGCCLVPQNKSQSRVMCFGLWWEAECTPPLQRLTVFVVSSLSFAVILHQGDPNSSKIFMDTKCSRLPVPLQFQMCPRRFCILSFVINLQWVLTETTLKQAAQAEEGAFDFLIWMHGFFLWKLWGLFRFIYF